MKAGIYSISASEYHADPCDTPSLSSSVAKILLQKSPLHAKAAHPRLTLQPVKEEAEHFDIGSIAHSLLLEGHLKNAVIINAKDWRKKAAQEARDLARAENKEPILARHMQSVRGMMDACLTQLNYHPDASDAFNPRFFGVPEKTLIWQEPNGVWCRARLDWFNRAMDPLVIDDYKTTGVSANPQMISRTLFANGWDIQAAFYCRGVQRLFGLDASRVLFRFIVQETAFPHALSVISLGPAAMALAEAKVSAAINLWGECLQTGNWPGYAPRIAYADVPPWEEQKWLEREAQDAEIQNG